MDKSQIIPSHIAQNPDPQQRIYQKTKMIQILQQKNSTLNREIQRIAQTMEEHSRQIEEKQKQEHKKDKLIQITNDPDLLDRQLKNCYKKIQLYEYEVQQIKNKSLSSNFNQKITGMETQFKQKKSIQDRLKQQLINLERQISQNSKRLSKNSHQHQIEKSLKTKADEMKFLKGMLKQYEAKDAIKQKNLKTEYSHIKKIEKEFVESGGSMHELQTVKHKALSQFQEGRLKQTANKETTEDYLDRFNKNHSKQSNGISSQNSSTINPQSQIIEDRTRSNYEALMNELNLLEKLNKKYQKQLDESQKLINDLDGKSELTRKRLDKVQGQIEDFNELIRLKKTCIIAENMKPTHRRSVRAVNVKEDLFSNSLKKQPVSMRKRNIINMTAIPIDNEAMLYRL